MATLKLGLNTAGRRVFLSNGLEAFRPHDIPKDAEVSISKGEAYIDKYRLLKRKKNIFERLCLFTSQDAFFISHEICLLYGLKTDF